MVPDGNTISGGEFFEGQHFAQKILWRNIKQKMTPWKKVSFKKLTSLLFILGSQNKY